MRGPKGIIGAFRALGKTRQPTLHPQGANAVTPSSQNFMGIALVRDIPDDFVLGRIKNRVQSDGHFNNTQTCAQMPARHRNSRDCFGPQLIRQLPKLAI